MLGNLAGFVAPVAGGVILERTGGDWNILIYTMAAAAVVSAVCWLYLNPESARRQRELAADRATANLSADGLSP
jgi:nitrate/nitrite transporter NarK